MKPYDASSIVVLSGLEPVRRRPGMYVGDTEDGTGLHNLLWQVVGEGVDNQLDGDAGYLRVTLHDDGGVEIEDDGKGIPLTSLDAAMTVLNGSPRSFAVVNALSSRLEIETCRDGRRHLQDYAAGVALGPVRDLGRTDRRGTRLRFMPDFSIFRRRPWDRALVARRLRELAALDPRLTTILDHRAFRCPAGLADHVRFLGRSQRSLHGEPVRIDGNHGDVEVDAALLWTAGPATRVRGFVGQARVRRGTHLAGLARGLFKAFVELDPARFRGVHPAAFREVLRPGLMAAVQTKLERPRFGCVRFYRLDNPEARTAVTRVVTRQLAGRLRADRLLRETLLAQMPG